MYRSLWSELLAWKAMPTAQRKPLLLHGARQVGKTHLSVFACAACQRKP